MQAISPTITNFFRTPFVHRSLLKNLIRREIESRFRGSILGLLWLIALPLVLLAVYSFVFGYVFKAKWGMPIETGADYPLLIFSGLIIFNFFSECIARAPTLMLENINYIKKVVFPLEILPWVLVGSALFGACISFLVLLCGYFYFKGVPPLTILLFPIILLPLSLFTYGIVSFLSATGVFLRDLKHLVGVFLTMLMFLSPIFYPVSSLPEKVRAWAYLNPLTSILEGGKMLLFWGQVPDLNSILLALSGSILVGWIGFAWFAKVRKGFADVV